MSREIKFRVFHNGEMYYLANSQMSELHLSLNNSHWGLFDGSARNSICTEKDGVLMQYTGLKDKNGVEIYEGDILKWEAGAIYGKTSVYSGKGHFYLSPYPFEENAMANEQFFIKQTEVIGNIHKDPELLK